MQKEFSIPLKDLKQKPAEGKYSTLTIDGEEYYVPECFYIKGIEVPTICSFKGVTAPPDTNITQKQLEKMTKDILGSFWEVENKDQHLKNLSRRIL